MNIENLRAFLEIASAGSFQLAAERLHVTQSAISARIQHLEERLNRQLFLRRRSGVQLTGAGQRFFQHAQSCVQSWERGQREIALPEEIENLIGLGVHLYFWQRVAQSWTGWMVRHAPQLATRIVSEFSDRLLSHLRDGVLDLVLVYHMRQGVGLVIEEFLEERVVLASTSAHALNQIQASDHVLVDWGDPFRSEHALAFPELPPPRLVLGSEAAALTHVLEHGGSGYFLESDIMEHVQTGRLNLIGDAPVFRRRSYLIYRKDTVIPDPIETAITGLKKILKQEPDNDGSR